MAPLGLIAGAGRLPVAVAEACRERGRDVFVVRLKGVAGEGFETFPGEDIGLMELGRCVKALNRAGCEEVCLAGKVEKPDFAALKPDLKALKYLPGVMAAAREGDDALLRAVLAIFEKEGFRIESVQDAAPELTLDLGPLGAVTPRPGEQADIAVAAEAAWKLGLTDAGQAAVARGGEVVALEDESGTDAMLRGLAPASGRAGVLAKIPKPIQDLRIDLPTIGVETVERAAAAGLAGIVGEQGRLLVVDKAAVRAAADRLGLFVVGLEPRTP